MTFASHESVSAIEDTLHGPLDTPRSIGPDGPEQLGQRADPGHLYGFNPAVVPPRYRDPLVREAVKAAGLLSVYDTAASVARLPRSREFGLQMEQWRSDFTQQIRAWVSRSETVDPQLKTVLDSVVRRRDHPAVKKIQDYLETRAVAEREALTLWHDFAALSDDSAKADFAEQLVTGRRALPHPVTASDPGPHDPGGAKVVHGALPADIDAALTKPVRGGRGGNPARLVTDVARETGRAPEEITKLAQEHPDLEYFELKVPGRTLGMVHRKPLVGGAEDLVMQVQRPSSDPSTPAVDRDLSAWRSRTWDGHRVIIFGCVDFR